MINIKIKGRITPYTPKYCSRTVTREELLLSDCDLPKKNEDKELYVNDRYCKINLGYGGKAFYIYPLDEPTPPKKPRLTDQEANNAHMRFCQTRDWERLLSAWEFNGRRNFRSRLLKNLATMKFKKNNCDSCNLRFLCLTEKRK